MSNSDKNPPNLDMFGFTERERGLIKNCVDYASSANPAGLPGHNLMVIIAKYHNIVSHLSSQNTVRNTPAVDIELNVENRMRESIGEINLFTGDLSEFDKDRPVHNYVAGRSTWRFHICPGCGLPLALCDNYCGISTEPLSPPSPG